MFLRNLDSCKTASGTVFSDTSLADVNVAAAAASTLKMSPSLSDTNTLVSGTGIAAGLSFATGVLVLTVRFF